MNAGWAVVAPSGAIVATAEPGEPREWADSYRDRLERGGAPGYTVVPRDLCSTPDLHPLTRG